MARYDRLAALAAPEREKSLPCWPVLRDLERAERDPDSGRRARLRFLALRPVHRLAAHGFAAVTLDSFERQVERVREELGQLPARDPERAVLAHFLNELRSSSGEAVIAATLQVSEFAESNGQLGAAEEYARCALGLSDTLHLDGASALRVLAHVMMVSGRPADAEVVALSACERALADDDRAEWIRAMGQLASAQRAGSPEQARATLQQALVRAREWGEASLIGLAQSSLSFHAAAQNQLDQAVEHGWAALRSLNGGGERSRLLLLLGDAFFRLNLASAAERCYVIVVQRATEAALRAAAQTGLARLAAAGEKRDQFHERRVAALRELQLTGRLPRAALQLELADAAARVGDVDFARDHVREALELLGHEGPPALVRRAENVLSQLESAATVALARPAAVSVTEEVRQIAAELELVADRAVTD
jgi:tetratricopeptide (TPR) repeat protein